jgi:hypothetical protein
VVHGFRSSREHFLIDLIGIVAGVAIVAGVVWAPLIVYLLKGN